MGDHADGGWYATEVEIPAHAYTMRGETITCQPAERRGVAFDVRTISQRVDDDMAELRAEVATLRAVCVDLKEAVDSMRQSVALLAGLDDAEPGA